MYGFDILVDDTFQPQVLEVQVARVLAIVLNFVFWIMLISSIYLNCALSGDQIARKLLSFDRPFGTKFYLLFSLISMTTSFDCNIVAHC